ncbi:MAG: hypothetical protein WA705_16370 [Candidatus Ozemobacteraceae bacterium]
MKKEKNVSSGVDSKRDHETSSGISQEFDETKDKGNSWKDPAAETRSKFVFIAIIICGMAIAKFVFGW